MAIGQRTPGILDEEFLQNIPNVFPAGEGPWISNQPTSAWPSSGVDRSLGSSWLREVDLPARWEQDPRGLLEEPSGFGSQGRSIALQMPEFPMFPFFGFPPMYGSPGVAPPGEQNPSTEPDYLGMALKLGGDVLKNLGPGAKPVSRFFKNPHEDAFGPEPQFDLQGNVTLDGKPSIEGTSFFEDQFNLGGEPKMNPATIQALKDYDAFNMDSNSIFNASYTPFDKGVGPAAGFGSEPGFSLYGTEGVSALNPADYSLGANAGSGVGLASTGVASWGAPAAAAITAIPHLLRLSDAKEAQDAASFTGSPAIGGVASAGLTAAAALAAGGAAAPFSAGISMFALPATLSLMKALGVGGQDKRTASDAETFQNMGDIMGMYLANSKYRPEALGEFDSYFDKLDPRTNLTNVFNNQRLPVSSDQWAQVRQTVDLFEAARKDRKEGRSPQGLDRINLSDKQRQEAQVLSNQMMQRIRDHQADLDRIEREKHAYAQSSDPWSDRGR